MVMNTLVSIQGIAKSYSQAGRQQTIYHDVSVDIAAAQKVALVGRSGSGKTTLLNLVSGIDLPDRGQVIVNGVDLGTLNETQRSLFRRHHIGFVFQFFNLIPTLTVIENLRLPLELKGESSAQAASQALNLLDRVGLLERQTCFPDALSGGEQQRVALARALIHRPPLVLADEPTGNLDADTGALVLALLNELVEENRATLLMVTHSADATAIVERTLEIQAGELTEKPRAA